MNKHNKEIKILLEKYPELPLKPVRERTVYDFECYCGEYNTSESLINNVISCKDCGLIMKAIV
tara:strand:+ start:533 stop:721 length:189 start_codon:yes stop_codon:yes gene_type:complete